MKSLIEEESISLNKLAADLGVSNSAVYYWVKGKTMPSADYIIALSDYFKVSADYILGLKDIY